MPKLRTISMGLVVGITLSLVPFEAAKCVDRLEIESRSDQNRLPYQFVVEQSNDWSVRKIPVGNQIQVLHPQMGSSDTAWYIHAFNSDINRDNPAVLSLEMYARGQVVDWNPLYLTLSSFALYRDGRSGQDGVVAVGHRNDSSFAAITLLGSDQYDFVFLATGEDHSGNDRWEGNVAPLLSEDYDFDGHDEVFLWVGPGRDLRPRVLVCLEPDTRSIEWSLPVAGAISSSNLYSCRDSTNPAVIFATYNFKNGVVDDNFDDNFCWLAKVNNRGEILHRRIISEEHGGKGLWPGESDGLFQVFHALPMVAPGDSGHLPPQKYQLSTIDSDFRVLASVDLDDRIVSTWWDPFDQAKERRYYTLSSDGFVRIFDGSLNLQAESDETLLRSFVDTFRLAGMDEPAYLFRTGSGLQFHSRQFEHLGTIEASFSRVQSLVKDDRGSVTHLVATDSNVNRIYSVRRLGFSDFVRLLFWQYQSQFLIALTLLALALFTVNMFRQRAVRRLALSERRLHDFFQTSQDGFYRSDNEGRFIWGSPAALKILGYDSVEEVKGTRIVDYYVDPAKRQLLIERIKKDGHVSDYEVKLRKKDGSIVVISTSSSFHRDSRGRIAGVEGVIRDVTERRAADKALVESEERYRSLVESASEAIFSLDRQGEFLFMNSIAAERLGGMPSDFIGKKMWDLFPKEQADSQMASILEVLDTGEGLVKETEVQLLGKLHRYITGIEPVKDTTGRVVAATAFARDISELALTRRQLETEKDFVRSLLDTANSLIVCLDNEARITVFNKGCEEVTGYSRAEVLGLRWPETFLPDESHHDGLDDFVNWVKEHPQDTYEGPLRTKSGEIRTILWSNSAMFNGAADEFVAIAVGQDITDKKQAQEALKESELRYASLVESTDIGIGVVDTQTREFLFVNSGMCRHLGFSQEEILKKSIETMHPPGAVEDAFRAFEGIVSGRINIFAELPFLHKDGSLRYFDVTGVIHDFDGRNAVIGYFRDVTERRQGQQALRESEDFNRAVIERSPVGVTVRNRAGRLLTYNEAWRRIWQVTDQDLHDYTTRERPELVFDKRDNYLGEWKDQVSRVYGEGGYLHIPEIEAEGSSKHKHLWLSQHFYALKDVTGQVDRVVVLTEDITERKQAEEALRESEERFRTLAEATPISMVVTNAANGTILYANLAVAESLGYKQSDLIGMKAVDLYLTPADRAQALDILRETGLVRNFETRVIRADGSYLWGLLSLSPITFHSEPAFFGSLVDITERREAEQRLREAEEARYNQVKQIAGGVAHEIYNALFPATSCLAKLSDRLPDGSTDDMQRNRRLLQLTESAVGRAIEMTDLVTRYSRLDSEQKTEPVALRSLLDEILETNADRINDLDIDVHLAVAEDVIISCRTDHLHSLFSNLLVNALDALEEVTARQIRVVASEEKGVVRIRFIDTGPGIPSEHRPRIFDPFFSTKPTRGTGLGLAIVKRIVELYGGRIDLEPMVDKGSIFVIFLKSARIDPS